MADEYKSEQAKQHAKQQAHKPVRVLGAVIIGALLLTYVASVVTGNLPEGRKLDAPALALLVLGCVSILLLLQPELLARFTRIEVGGLKVELEKLREQQTVQKSELEDLRMLVPLLFPKTERQHLLHLRDGDTKAYKGRDTLKVELRHLRGCGLIKMREKRRVRDIPVGTTFDLAGFVELTEFGKQWLERIKELESETAE